MPRPASNGAMANLTLTRVVFELLTRRKVWCETIDLTLTRVVFE